MLDCFRLPSKFLLLKLGLADCFDAEVAIARLEKLGSELGTPLSALAILRLFLAFTHHRVQSELPSDCNRKNSLTVTNDDVDNCHRPLQVSCG